MVVLAGRDMALLLRRLDRSGRSSRAWVMFVNVILQHLLYVRCGRRRPRGRCPPRRWSPPPCPPLSPHVHILYAGQGGGGGGREDDPLGADKRSKPLLLLLLLLWRVLQPPVVREAALPMHHPGRTIFRHQQPHKGVKLTGSPELFVRQLVLVVRPAAVTVGCGGC